MKLQCDSKTLNVAGAGLFKNTSVQYYSSSKEFSALRVSSPSGNQVDGSPLVADTETVAKPAGRGGARRHS